MSYIYNKTKQKNLGLKILVTLNFGLEVLILSCLKFLKVMVGVDCEQSLIFFTIFRTCSGIPEEK